MTTMSILDYTQVGRFTVYAVSLVTRVTHAVTLGSQKAQLIINKLLHIYCIDIFLEIVNAVLLCYSRTSGPAVLLSYSRTDPAVLLSYSRTDPVVLLC